MNLKIKDLIFRQNNLVPKDKCKYFIKIFEKHKDKCEFEHSKKYNEEHNKKIITDNYECLNLSKFYENHEIKETADLAVFYINIILSNYINYLKINISKFITDEFINSTSNIRILKYSKGSQIIDHLDANPFIRASCTLNLNEEYEGGEFTFFSGKHFEIFKTGDVMIFPAEPIWIHGTKPVLSGERYAINCFLNSKRKDLK
jgi:hypothetical protein